MQPKTSTDLTKMKIDLDIIDQEDNKTRRKIYEAIYEFHFIGVTLLTDDLIEQCKTIETCYRIFHMI